MENQRIKEFEQLTEKAKGAIRLMVDQIQAKGYVCNMFYLKSVDKQEYDAPFLDGTKWNSYVDDILSEMRLEMCRYSPTYGRAYIIGIIRKFIAIDSYCHPQYNIKNEIISTEGVVKAFEILQLKHKDLRGVGFAKFAISFAYFYNVWFKRRFIILCKDCGYDYNEIEAEVNRPYLAPNLIKKTSKIHKVDITTTLKEHTPNVEVQKGFPIDETALGACFNAKFKGAGGNMNYMANLIEDLRKERCGKDFARIALLIQDSDYLITTWKKEEFSKWYSHFCKVIGCKYVKYDPCKLRDEKFQKVKRVFYYL